MNKNTILVTKLLVINWGRFSNEEVMIKGSTLITGYNATGKSMLVDAMTYLFMGNTQFNKAADAKRDRNVRKYVHGDTNTNGNNKYLRPGAVISYIAAECFDPQINKTFVAAVCIESKDMSSCNENWFAIRDAKIEDINFTHMENGKRKTTPKRELTYKGNKIKGDQFYSKKEGILLIQTMLNLKCNANEYRNKIIKMLAFDPESNIDNFMREYIFDEKEIKLDKLKDEKEGYDGLGNDLKLLQEQQKDLSKIIESIDIYEKVKDDGRKKALVFDYQGIKQMGSKKEELEREIARQKTLYTESEEEKGKLVVEQKYASERLNIAKSNVIGSGLGETVNTLERQIESYSSEKREYEESVLKLKKLQGKLCKLSEVIPECKEIKGLSDISGDKYTGEKKNEIFHSFKETITVKQNEIISEKVIKEERLKVLNEEIGQLQKDINKLERNLSVFPKDVEETKSVILKELKKKGINTEIKTFAELVKEVTIPEWAQAVETYIGKRRFNFIVDEKFYGKVTEIMKSNHLSGLVMTSALPETEIKEGTASELLVIPNQAARKYANYLLNGLYLCNSDEKLNEHPLGGITKDGSVSKGYVLSYRDIKKTTLYFGEEAQKKQLERAKDELKELKEESQILKEAIRNLDYQDRTIKDINLDPDYYDFSAVEKETRCKDKIRHIRNEIEKINKSDEFMALLEEQVNAGKEYEVITQKIYKIDRDIGATKNKIDTDEKEIEKLNKEISELNLKFSEKLINETITEEEIKKEYEKNTAKKYVIKEDTLKQAKSAENKASQEMEKLQFNYCYKYNNGHVKSGESSINDYRKKYKEISDYEMPDIETKRKEREKMLANIFMAEFVNVIGRYIRSAENDVKALNRKLKEIPFGRDTYKFIVTKRTDGIYKNFFEIHDALNERYLGNPENYMSGDEKDEEMEENIKEFVGAILSEEDESEYTDYRKYFNYDVEITTRQGDEIETSNLSNKNKSGSGGEKQTPYYIILAASLMMHYPKDKCCARLAFIDEAFSVLDGDRLENLVKYFKDNDLQVFYCTPPEKINNIGKFVDTGIVLSPDGRYSTMSEINLKEYIDDLSKQG